MPPQQNVSTRKRSLEGANVWVIIATLVLTALFFIPSSSGLSSVIKMFILAGGTIVTLALYIFARLSRGNVIFPPYLLLGVLWLPAIAYGLSAAFSGATFQNALWGATLGEDTFAFILAATFLGTLTALVLRRSEQIRLFLSAAAWLYGIVVAFQIIVLIIGQITSSVAAGFSILGSYNDLALFAGLGLLGSLLAARFLELSKQVRVALSVVGVGALVLLAVANSSLVWVMVALGSLGLFVESIMRRGATPADSDMEEVSVVSEHGTSGDSGNRSFLLPLIVLAISLFFLIGASLGSALASSLNVSAVSVRPSWQSTFTVAGHVYSHSPIFGSGPNTFGQQWLKYRDASLNSTVFWNLDFSTGIGFIPTSFVTTGILGAIAWLVLLAALLFVGARTLIRRAPQDAYMRFATIVTFLGAIYLFAVAIFDQPSPLLLALLFVFIGVFASTTRYAEKGRQWGVVFSRAPRIGFVVVFALTLLLLVSVAAAYALVDRSIGSYELALASSALSSGNTAKANTLAQSSASFAQTPEAYLLQAEVANSQLNAIASSSTMPAATAQKQFQATLSTGINAALTATQLAPNDYRGWVALGNLYAQAVPLKVSGAFKSAQTAYQKAETLSPTNAQIPFIQAQLEIANGDAAAAQKDLKAAIALKQNYTSAIFLLSQLEVQTGNVKEALKNAEAAAYFTPNNPNILFQIGILSAAQNDLTTAKQALSQAVSINPSFANARYFLAAVEAKQGDLKGAATQLQAVANLSSANQKAVAAQLTSLQAGKDPFPANLLSASSTPVQQGQTTSGATASNSSGQTTTQVTHG